MPIPFHLALNITDLDETRAFYGSVLGCEEGWSTESWVDYDFFGHQLSLHLGQPFDTANTGKVGDHMVAIPHFGVVLAYNDWRGPVPDPSHGLALGLKTAFSCGYYSS